MDDGDLMARINDLAREEHELWEREGEHEMSATDRQRLEKLQVMLDQLWDLLHQRRARRAAGMDPDAARVRDESVVEGYVE